MIERFQRDGGRALLVEALRDQVLIHGDSALAAEIANVVLLEEHASGTRIITQDHSDNDMFLVLSGEVSIVINGREMARRQAGQHVGEMALIDPSARRSASVECRGEVLTARITERQFAQIADKAPRLWRRLAVELSKRLRQRTAFIRQRNETPILFIGSSSESLPIAETVKAGLARVSLIVRVWTDDVFGASRFPIDDLESQIAEADFAALVLGPDDKVVSRGRESDAPRDNVIFELGLFMGGLGRRRSFLVVPRELEIKIPTDLLGLTPISYTSSLKLPDALTPVCEEIVKAVTVAGAR